MIDCDFKLQKYTMMVPVAKLEEIPENGSRSFLVDGHNLLLVRSAAGIFAIENLCSHAYSPLEGGKVRGPHIACPTHAVRFDMRNGCPSGGLTQKPIKVWHAEIIDGDVAVDFARRNDPGV